MKAKGGRRFAGFSPAALAFLRDLAKHNDRSWFVPRKHVYEKELVEPLDLLLIDVSDALRKAKIPIGADPKGARFRIYRDVRFSKDKRPYKTNLGAYLGPGGDRKGDGGLYIHIEPKHCFIIAAFHALDKPELQRWRSAMAKDPKRFSAMLAALKRNGLAVSDKWPVLKRMPRGFEGMAQSPIAKYFMLGSFNAGEELTDKEACQGALVDRVVSLAKRAKPLFDYGWRALAK